MELVSTRDPGRRASFLEAVVANVPGDGGLFVPARLAPLPPATIATLLAMPWPERATALLAELLGDELARDEIAELTGAAFDFPVPLVRLPDGLAVLELFHGPSLSFKDFGVRFLARLLALLARREAAAGRAPGPRTVPPAPSGDTGAAVALASHGLPALRVAVLYPRGRISNRQERQMATLGGNVRAFAVDGSFDDCQRLVKASFAAPALVARHGLVAANSINIARLLAQVLYYFEAVAAAGDAPPPVVCVPSGNFGNLCAGLLARRLGLPLGGLALATNANTTVPDYLDGGAWRPRPSLATLSNAMDVGAPSNWERIAWLHGDDREALRAALRWGSLDDDGTRREIARLAALGYAVDPHGAVASAVLRRLLRPGERGLFLGTAHPAKFEVSGAAVPPPPPPAAAPRRPLPPEPLPATEAALHAALAAWPA